MFQKNPAIKLFGRTIPLVRRPGEGEQLADSDPVFGNDAGEKIEVESKGRTKSSSVSLPSGLTITDIKGDERETEKENERESEKSLKRPDKILPCPRCNSQDTKFCYYNNYNVNQPRHFCKNCQRYWTAGGTMRNVPVGAGRRRSKPSPLSPDAVSRGFHSWGLDRESSESGSSFPAMGTPWIKGHADLPSSPSPGCSLERENPNLYLGSALFTSTDRVNCPNAPGSSSSSPSSLGKHSRETTDFAGEQEKICLSMKAVKVNTSNSSSGGSTLWVNPDVAETMDERVNP